MTDFAYAREYQLPRGYSVKFNLENGRLECRWSPDVPNARRGRQILPAYRKARDDFLASLSVRMLVVEI